MDTDPELVLTSIDSEIALHMNLTYDSFVPSKLCKLYPSSEVEYIIKSAY